MSYTKGAWKGNEMEYRAKTMPEILMGRTA